MRPIRFTYAIGDVQGCYDPLMRLLEKLNFCETQDCLWFTGDIINRGPQSLETLRFIKNLPHCVTVLGNHDIHLITAFDGVYRPHPKDTLEDILQAPDAEVLIDFLRTRPLLYEDKKYNVGLVHAGIHPLWDWEAAKQYAQEAEGFIQNKILWLDNLNYFYGNHPDQWSDNLKGLDRIRLIFNIFTRMRICRKDDAQCDFIFKGPLSDIPKNYYPWFAHPQRKNLSINKILFGHWSHLRGTTNQEDRIALDTGCIWGGPLTAYCLEKQTITSVFK